MPMAQDPLIEVSKSVEHSRAAGQKVAVIFDLDSTLFSVSPRTEAILRKLGHQREFAAEHVELSAILRDVEVLPTDWGIKSVLERARAPGDIEVFKKVRNFWRDHFFTNHFLDRDTIYPSANEYVTHLHSLGAEILYLTGRNDGSMREGSARMLQHWGFPYFGDSHLYMKPSDVQTDEGFKANLLASIAERYDLIWFFENEPLIIDLVRARVPQVRIVFVNSVHSGRAVAPVDLPTIGMNYASGIPPKKV
ncbi:MAG: HAD family hydrolase [Bdellovibrionales bacterium]